MSGIKYAFVQNGIVVFIEERTPISNYYHPTVIKNNFVKIPKTQIVDIGYFYKDGEFTKNKRGAQ